MLQNRFHLGELPDGNDGWLPSAHQPVLDAELFEQAQSARQANGTGAAKVRRGHRRCSLTGLAVCCHCGGRLHFNTAPNGRARFYCYQGRQATSCEQRSGMLNPIEEQLATYLTTFALPEDMVQQLITLYEQATAQRDDTVRRRRELSVQLSRIKDLNRWGDLERESYQSERDRHQAKLATMRDATDHAAVLAQAAAYLRDLPDAWRAATPEERKHFGPRRLPTGRDYRRPRDSGAPNGRGRALLQLGDRQ